MTSLINRPNNKTESSTMDIRKPEAIDLLQRCRLGKMLLVPEGIRDVERHQVFGKTSNNRFYRYDEDIDQYAILSPKRDRYTAVPGLASGETVLRGTGFNDADLLPDRTFWEQCVEEHLPSLGWTAVRALLGGAVFQSAFWLWAHVPNILGTIRAIFASPQPAAHLHNLHHNLHQEGFAMPMRAAGTTPAAATRLSDPYPHETGWAQSWPDQANLSARLDTAARTSAPSVAGLSVPIVAGAALGAGAHLATRNTRPQPSGPAPQHEEG